jgi:glycosyltransferase involved in cell wall biosynthesis
MRILMLTQFYLPTFGGEEHYVRTLSWELAARGHEVAVATTRGAGQPAFDLDGKVRVYRMRGTAQRAPWLFKDSERRHAPPFPDPELTLALRSIVAQESPDVVHAHNWLVRSFIPLKVWSGAKLVLSLHDYNLVCAKQDLLHRGAHCSGPGLVKCLACAGHHYGAVKGGSTTLANWAMSSFERAAVDLYLPVSAAAAAGNRLAARRAPFHVVPNFLPDDFGSPAPPATTVVADLPSDGYILYVGDLRRFKGLYILLDAYAQLSGAPPLVLIGRICPDAPTHYPPGVLVLHDWTRAAVMEAWRGCLFGVLPSIGPETFGMVLIEAMAAGRPVVASRIGGIAGIVRDGETGILVPPGDPVALRDALQQLLGDSEQRRRMGAAAQQRVAAFRASAVVPQIEHIYRQLVEEGLPDPDAHPDIATGERA